MQQACWSSSRMPPNPFSERDRELNMRERQRTQTDGERVSHGFVPQGCELPKAERPANRLKVVWVTWILPLLSHPVPYLYFSWNLQEQEATTPEAFFPFPRLLQPLSLLHQKGNFTFCSHKLRSLGAMSFCPRGRNASFRKHNKYSALNN